MGCGGKQRTKPLLGIPEVCEALCLCLIIYSYAYPHNHRGFNLALGDVPVVLFPLLGKKPAAIPLTARGNTIIIDVGRLKWEGVPNEVPALW